MHRRRAPVGFYNMVPMGRSQVPCNARSSTMDALPSRSLLMRVLDALVEWQMRQSLRAICRGQRACRQSEA